MPPNSTVCAIIPTYNRAAMLKECIESILTQTRLPNEIIIVDDGSTDDTASIARAFGNRVRLISKPNGGKASALNKALEQCVSDYVWICDDDDIAAPDGMERLASALDADASLDFVFGTFRIFRDTPKGRAYTPPTYWHRGEETNPKINFLEEMFTFQYAILVRRSLYETVGLFREDLIRSQDYEMTLRLTRKTKSAYVPHAIFYQRRHDGTRGSLHDSFSADAALHKWRAYDRKIFADIHRDYALEEFTPSFALPWGPEDARRAALIERASIFAKHAMWDTAIADLRAAAQSAYKRPRPEEIRIAETVIRSVHPWNMLAQNPQWIENLRTIYRMNPYGKRIILAVCRPLLWQARKHILQGDFGGAKNLLKLLFAISGIRGAAKRGLLTMISRA